MSATAKKRDLRPASGMTEAEKLAAVHAIEDRLKDRNTRFMFREVVSRPDGVRATALAKKFKVHARAVGHMATAIRAVANEVGVNPDCALDPVNAAATTYRSKLHMGSAPPSDTARLRDELRTQSTRETFDTIIEAGAEGVAATDLPTYSPTGGGVGPVIHAILLAADRVGLDRAKVLVREHAHGRVILKTSLPQPTKVTKKAPVTLKEARVMAVLTRRPQSVARIAANAVMGILSTSQAVRGLVDKGLVQMIGSNYRLACRT